MIRVTGKKFSVTFLFFFQNKLDFIIKECYNLLVMNSHTYKLELIEVFENGNIATMLTDIDTAEYREEHWKNESGNWIWENGWGTNSWDSGLYEVLNNNDEATDGMLNQLLEIGELEIQA